MKTLRLFMCLLPGLLAAQSVSLTVYNQNRALVRELRPLVLVKGQSEIAFTDVAAKIDPTSVHFKSLSAPGKLVVLEQNFEYDLVGAQKILSKYIDQPVRLVMTGGEVFEGMLLSSGRDLVLGQDEGRIRIVSAEKVQHFDFPSLPEGLKTRPTLIWKVVNSGPTRQETELNYLTSGINWHAEYIAVVAADDKRLDLSGWVSIDNQSGASYKNARLKLVAGDVNLLSPQRRSGGNEVRMALAAAPKAGGFEEKSFFEYHLYTLDRATTVKNNQIKQIALFPAASTPVRKRYLFDGSRMAEKVQVALEFENKKKTGLGMPLPKGKVRVYKADDDGSLTFIGEDRLDHTPRDESVKVTMGNAFDLKGRRRVLSQNRTSDRSREEKIEILLKNHKDEPVEFRVVEHSWGEWRLKKSSHEAVKQTASTFYFDIPVPAHQEVTVSYTIFSKW